MIVTRQKISRTIFLFFLLASLRSYAADLQWVTTSTLDRKTCPSIKCGTAGELYFREGVEVFESKNGWSRITRPYDAFCANGKSQYVKRGNMACISTNGIIDGKFSEWVESKRLSKARPEDPAKDAKGEETLVSESDDYREHKTIFLNAAKKLISSQQCTAHDFRENGGWMKSQNKGKGIYFIYCGGLSENNKIYLNSANGTTFR